MPYVYRVEGNPQAPIKPNHAAITFPAWYLSIRASLLQKLRRANPIMNGYRLYFQGNEEIRAYRDNDEDRTSEDLKAYIKLEAQRCPFLTMELSQDGRFFVLTLIGPEGTQTWLAEDYGL